jgi:hypothetical protein
MSNTALPTPWVFITEKIHSMSRDKKEAFQITNGTISTLIGALALAGLYSIKGDVENLRSLPAIIEQQKQHSGEIKAIKEILARNKLAQLDNSRREITTAQYDE